MSDALQRIVNGLGNASSRNIPIAHTVIRTAQREAAVSSLPGMGEWASRCPPSYHRKRRDAPPCGGYLFPGNGGRERVAGTYPRVQTEFRYNRHGRPQQ